MFTRHALDRIGGREISQDLLARVDNLAAHCRMDTAIRVARVSFHGDNTQAYRDRAESNGEEIWAIVRDARVVTMMYRRANQPATREALRVQAIRGL